MITCATCRHFHRIEGSVLTLGQACGHCREHLHSVMVPGPQGTAATPVYYPIVPEVWPACGRYALQLVGANGEAEISCDR